MSEQQAQGDADLALQGDLEAIFDKLLRCQHPSPDDLNLLAWACGVNLETVKRQQEVCHD